MKVTQTISVQVPVTKTVTSKGADGQDVTTTVTEMETQQKQVEVEIPDPPSDQKSISEDDFKKANAQKSKEEQDALDAAWNKLPKGADGKVDVDQVKSHLNDLLLADGQGQAQHTINSSSVQGIDEQHALHLQGDAKDKYIADQQQKDNATLANAEKALATIPKDSPGYAAAEAKIKQLRTDFSNNYGNKRTEQADTVRGDQTPNLNTKYTVKSGDTLGGIARDHGTDWKSVWDANKDQIPNPDLIYPGQELQIPGKPPEDAAPKLEDDRKETPDTPAGGQGTTPTTGQGSGGTTPTTGPANPYSGQGSGGVQPSADPVGALTQQSQDPAFKDGAAPPAIDANTAKTFQDEQGKWNQAAADHEAILAGAKQDPPKFTQDQVDAANKQFGQIDTSFKNRWGQVDATIQQKVDSLKGQDPAKLGDTDKKWLADANAYVKANPGAFGSGDPAKADAAKKQVDALNDLATKAGAPAAPTSQGSGPQGPAPTDEAGAVKDIQAAGDAVKNLKPPADAAPQDQKDAYVKTLDDYAKRVSDDEKLVKNPDQQKALAPIVGTIQGQAAEAGIKRDDDFIKSADLKNPDNQKKALDYANDSAGRLDTLTKLADPSNAQDAADLKTYQDKVKDITDTLNKAGVQGAGGGDPNAAKLPDKPKQAEIDAVNNGTADANSQADVAAYVKGVSDKSNAALQAAIQSGDPNKVKDVQKQLSDAKTLADNLRNIATDGGVRKQASDCSGHLDYIQAVATVAADPNAANDGKLKDAMGKVEHSNNPDDFKLLSDAVKGYDPNRAKAIGELATVKDSDFRDNIVKALWDNSGTQDDLQRALGNLKGSDDKANFQLVADAAAASTDKLNPGFKEATAALAADGLSNDVRNHLKECIQDGENTTSDLVQAMRSLPDKNDPNFQKNVDAIKAVLKYQNDNGQAKDTWAKFSKQLADDSDAYKHPDQLTKMADAAEGVFGNKAWGDAVRSMGPVGSEDVRHYLAYAMQDDDDTKHDLQRAISAAGGDTATLQAIQMVAQQKENSGSDDDKKYAKQLDTGIAGILKASNDGLRADLKNAIQDDDNTSDDLNRALLDAKTADDFDQISQIARSKNDPSLAQIAITADARAQSLRGSQPQTQPPAQP